MSGFVGAIRESGNALLIRISVIAAIGGLLFGYDTGVISGALLYIKKDLDAGTFEQQAIVAVLLLGAMVGALLSGYLANRISRKWTKVLSGTIYFVAALGCAFSVNAEMLIGFRFLLGISVGTASFVSPLYISEVSPPRVRGGLVSFNQLAVVSGILLAYIVNYLFKDFTEEWRWMLGVAALPGAVLAIGMLTVPQTPRWLMLDGQRDKARKVLERLRAGDEHADLDAEMEDMEEANEAEQGTKVRDLLSSRLRPVLIVGVVLAAAQQFVGGGGPQRRTQPRHPQFVGEGQGAGPQRGGQTGEVVEGAAEHVFPRPTPHRRRRGQGHEVQRVEVQLPPRRRICGKQHLKPRVEDKALHLA